MAYIALAVAIALVVSTASEDALRARRTASATRPVDAFVARLGRPWGEEDPALALVHVVIVALCTLIIARVLAKALAERPLIAPSGMYKDPIQHGLGGGVFFETPPPP